MQSAHKNKFTRVNCDKLFARDSLSFSFPFRLILFLFFFSFHNGVVSRQSALSFASVTVLEWVSLETPKIEQIKSLEMIETLI